jgi:hypothetical protein
MEPSAGMSIAELIVTDPARLQWIFQTYPESDRGRPGILHHGDRDDLRARFRAGLDVGDDGDAPDDLTENMS